MSLARDLGFSLEHGGMSSGGALHLGRTLPLVVFYLVPACYLVLAFLIGYDWQRPRR